MLRAVWFAVKVGLLVALAVWVAQRPGTIEIHWIGYEIRAQIGFVLLGALVALLFILALYRVLLAVFSMPKSLRRYRAEIRQGKGQRALALGLTAVAAGDSKLAAYHAHRTRKFMPEDKGLSVLLEGQAARLRGDDEAAGAAFETLLNNKDTAFLGLRGLLLAALESGDTGDALNLSRRALAMHPRQPWVLRMVYDLEIRQGHWQEARAILDSAVKNNAVDPARADRDRIAILLLQAEKELLDGQERAAFDLTKRAFAVDPGFVPAAAALARWYIGHGKRRVAIAVLEKSWRLSPHPDLVALWKELEPKGRVHDSAARMAWYERLVALRPDSAEGQMAAAAAAIEERLWGSVQQYLERAEAAGPGPRLYRLKARLAQIQNRPEETALMLRKADESPPEKAWICRETGHVYERWTPVAEPHGSFNSIVWDYPGRLLRPEPLHTDRSELLVMGPAVRRGT